MANTMLELGEVAVTSPSSGDAAGLGVPGPRSPSPWRVQTAEPHTEGPYPPPPAAVRTPGASPRPDPAGTVPAERWWPLGTDTPPPPLRLPFPSPPRDFLSSFPLFFLFFSFLFFCSAPVAMGTVTFPSRAELPGDAEITRVCPGRPEHGGWWWWGDSTSGNSTGGVSPYERRRGRAQRASPRPASPRRPALPFPFPALIIARVSSFHRLIIKAENSQAGPAKARRAAGVWRAGRAPRWRCWDAAEMGQAEGFQGHLKKQRDLIMFRHLLTVQQVVLGGGDSTSNESGGGEEGGNGRVALNMPNVRL